MKVNIHLRNAIVYDVEKFDVLMGEGFRLEVVDHEGVLRWFADQDLVLQVIDREDGKEALVTAETPGQSEIQLQDGDQKVLKTLRVRIYTLEAAQFKLTHGEPERR